MINQVSSIRGIYVGISCVATFLGVVVCLLVTGNTTLLPGIVLILCVSVAGTIIILSVADLSIDNDELRITTFLKTKKIDMGKLIISGMEKPNQGMFYLHTNFGFLMINFNYKNYQEIKKIICTCKKSNITIEQFEVLTGKKFKKDR
jgi:hypothetical protein